MSSWTGKRPDEMSHDELKTARKALVARFAAAQVEVGVLQTAVHHLTGEIGRRYDLDIPGTPPVAALAEYPTDDIVARFPNG